MAPPAHVPEGARQVLSELTQALGTENVPNQWGVFMKEVTRLLPDVLSPGRPTAQAIRDSVIGQLGHKGWRQMLEASPDQHGLGLRWSTWKQWRRAWSVVEQNPWLLDHPLAAAQVNRLAEQVRKAGGAFPSDASALAAFTAERDARRKAERRESISDLVMREQRALAQVEALFRELAGARDQVEALAARLDRSELTTQHLEGEVAGARRALQRLEEEGRWAHFLRAVGLR
jgi:hypothetical protein